MYGLSNSTLTHYYANYILHYKILEASPLRPTKKERPLDSSSNVYDRKAPSGTFSANSDTPASTLFEQQQTELLNKLIQNKKTRKPNQKLIHKESEQCPENCVKMECADTSLNSFTFPVEADTFEKSSASPDRHSFSKASVEDINTSFANDAGPSQWQFSAGTGEDEANVGRRSSAARPLNRRTPIKRPSKLRTDNANDAFPAPQAETEFNAEGWSDKFSTQTFVPPPAPGPSVSPGRTSRTNSKKSKARPTAGNAAVVVDISSDEESYKWQGRNPQSGSLGGAQSVPQAMDIDSPASTTPPVASSSHTASNVPVEQSRSEWQAEGAAAPSANDDKPARPAKIPLSSNAAGSEDSDEFRASFADLKNVAPLSPQRDGLNSFAGLKDNLPFESKASDVPPVRLPKTYPLEFPAAPEAPRLPPTVAVGGIKPNLSSWEKYEQEFETYLRQWDTFNGQVVEHFATRKALIKSIREAKGYGFLATRGDADLQEYYAGVQQDNDVRRRWIDACEDHENRLREFMAFRDRMK